jgi:hypothetical protein
MSASRIVPSLAEKIFVYNTKSFEKINAMINNKVLLHLSLENHFHTVDKIILSRQDAVTGLRLPVQLTAHGDYNDAWVRDNVYSIMCLGSVVIVSNTMQITIVVIYCIKYGQTYVVCLRL